MRNLRWEIGRRTLTVLALTAGFEGNIFAQGMLEVARSQLAAGLTEDARVLVENQFSAASAGQEKDQARYLQAILTAGADSAALRLEDLLARGDFPGALRAEARERLGDLAFTRGRYADAAGHWKLAAGESRSVEDHQRLLVKTARAHLRLAQPYEALTPLREALELGETPQAGMLRYWRGLAKEAAGDREGAGGEYMVAYSHPEQGFGLAALQRLDTIYGGGKGKTSAQWRKRREESSRNTIFDSRGKLVPAAAYSIQLGAFSTEARARSQAGTIRSLGLSPTVLPPKGKGLYRVTLEGIQSRGELEKIETLLKKKHIQYQVLSSGG